MKRGKQREHARERSKNDNEEGRTRKRSGVRTKTEEGKVEKSGKQQDLSMKRRIGSEAGDGSGSAQENESGKQQPLSKKKPSEQELLMHSRCAPHNS